MDFILENFDTLFSKEKSYKKLEEIILDLAIKGKLVPQDQNDEPASELLKKIEAEKEILIKDKKIKKEKKLVAISEEEVPFEIPENWEWVKLGNFAIVRGGKRLPKGCEFSEFETPYIYLRVTDMKSNSINDFGHKFINEETYEQIKNYIIEKDDLYITIAGTIGQIGEVPERFHNMNLTENAAKITSYKVDKKWLMLFLGTKFIQKQFSEMVNKMAQPKLAIGRILETHIPLPPLKEQKRIVAKIEELKTSLDTLREKSKKAERTREKLKKSILSEIEKSSGDAELLNALELVFQNFDIVIKSKEDIKEIRDLILSMAVKGKLVSQDENNEPASELLKRIKTEKEILIKDKKIKKEKELAEISEKEIPFEIPKSWEWVRLGEVIMLLSGQDISHNECNSNEIGIPYIMGASNIQNNSILIERWIEKPKVVGIQDDILISCKGTVGKIIIQDLELAHLSRQIMGVRNIYKLNNKYLKLFFDATVEKIKNKSQGLIPGISRGDILNITFPIPPLLEQNKIVIKVDELMKSCDKLEENVNLSEEVLNNLVENL